MDMAVVDIAWIAMKLRKLLDYQEPMGRFFARVPGERTSRQYPSIVSYVAHLMVYRYASLGLLTDSGYPVASLGVMVDALADSKGVVARAAR